MHCPLCIAHPASYLAVGSSIVPLGMGVSFSLVHLRTGRAPGAPFLPSACSAFVPCRSGHAGNHLDFTQVAFCVRRLPEVAYIAVIPPALPQVHLLPWTLPRHRSFSSLLVVRLVFASLGCRTRAYLCDHQQATRPHESAACGAALGSVVDCVGSGTPLGSLISGGAPTLLCCCLWCSSCPLHPLRPQVPSTHRGGIALIAGSHYIVMGRVYQSAPQPLSVAFRPPGWFLRLLPSLRGESWHFVAHPTYGAGFPTRYIYDTRIYRLRSTCIRPLRGVYGDHRPSFHPDGSSEDSSPCSTAS